MHNFFGQRRRWSRACALFVLLAIGAGVVPGQKRAVRRPTPRVSPVLERNVRAEMNFLASDALRGRGSATDDERLAAEYIGSQFAQFGLAPAGDKDANGAQGFVQRVPLEAVRYSEKPVLRATSEGRTETWQYGRDLLTPFLTAPGASGQLQVLDAAGTPSKGAVVAYKTPLEDKPGARQSLMSRAILAGAVAVILPESEAGRRERESGKAKLPSLPARLRDAAHGSAGRRERPAFVLINMRRESFEELTALPAGTRLEFGGATEPVVSGATWNVVGMLPGSDPPASSEAILLSAHLDHLGIGEPVNGDAIYNGADDDASGCVAVLELARALAAGPRLRRTIYFVCFGSEEKGGFGATYFVEHSPVPLTRLVANLEFEMIGRPDPKVPPLTLWLTGYDRSNLGPELARQGARIVADPHPEQNFFRRSDNYTLALRGVVAQTVSSFGLHADYHRPSDEASKIDFQQMTRAINSLVGPVRWLAVSTFKPSWVPGRAPVRG